MNEAIEHRAAVQRFVVEVDQSSGYLEYKLSASVIDFTHTIVPKELGGRGLGTDLVKYGLAYARVQHLKVIPSCPFVAAIMDKNTVYHDLRVG